MGLAKSVPSSIGYTRIETPKVKYTPPLVQEEELQSTFHKVADDEYTHDEALAFLHITETEFLELLVESGNCPSGKLDKNRLYPKELIFKIDPGKWKDPKVYTLEDLYGDVVNSSYTLEEALEILEITESKFKERSLDRGFCTADEFNNIKEFPFKWVWYIDNYY